MSANETLFGTGHLHGTAQRLESSGLVSPNVRRGQIARQASGAIRQRQMIRPSARGFSTFPSCASRLSPEEKFVIINQFLISGLERCVRAWADSPEKQDEFYLFFFCWVKCGRFTAVQ